MSSSLAGEELYLLRPPSPQMLPHYLVKSFVPLGPRLDSLEALELVRGETEAAAFQIWVLEWQSLVFMGQASLKSPTLEGHYQHREAEYEDAGKGYQCWKWVARNQSSPQ